MFKANNTMGFIPIKSTIHDLDPRSKIIISALFMFSVFMAKHLYGLLILTIFALILIILSNIAIKDYWQGIKPFYFLIGISALIQVLLTRGGKTYQVFFLHISQSGLEAGLVLLIRLLLILLVAQLLILTTSTLAMTDGLDKMLKPLSKVGFPSEELLMIMTIALRFLPLLMNEAVEVKKAQIGRGAEFESGSLIVRLKKQILIIVPVFNLALQRAVDLSQAMESRAYAPGAVRSRLHELQMTSRDYLIIVITLILVTITLYWR